MHMRTRRRLFNHQWPRWLPALWKLAPTFWQARVRQTCGNTQQEHRQYPPEDFFA